MPSFSDALNRSMEDIKRPPPPPQGKYIARVTQVPTDLTPINTANGTLMKLTVPLGLVSAMEDVDPDDLAAYGAVTSANLRMDFLFDEGDSTKFESTLDRLKNFIIACGATFDGTEPLKEVLPRIVNAQLIIDLAHRLDPKDNTNIYTEVKRYYPLA